jgi:hypothetical protein
MPRPPRSILLACAAVAIVAASALGGARPSVYTVPADAAFPEGIALDHRGTSFFVSSTTDGTINTGRLFRIDTRTKAVSEVDLGGETVAGGDGLVPDGSRLFVVRHAGNMIVEVRLLRGRREGRIGTTIASDELRFPTTAARDGARLLAVNSQFDERGGMPVLPFTVAAVAMPSRIAWRLPWHAGWGVRGGTKLTERWSE